MLSIDRSNTTEHSKEVKATCSQQLGIKIKKIVLVFLP